MRTQIKDSWLKVYINKPKELYREYKTYYNKILNINKIFYYHRITNVPIHQETSKLLVSKIENYLRQMDILYYAAKDCEVVTANMPKSLSHRLAYYLPLGTWENSVYLSRNVSKKEFFQLCKLKREPLIVTEPSFFGHG